LPVYVYRCDDCSSRIERRQSFSDAPLTECDVCGGALRKVLQPASVIYKGSGFYSTDSRSKSGGNGTARSDNGENGSKPEESPPKAAEEAAKPASSDD
jgi:putative FmdB family regulatory protein